MYGKEGRSLLRPLYILKFYKMHPSVQVIVLHCVSICGDVSRLSKAVFFVGCQCKWVEVKTKLSMNWEPLKAYAAL